MAANQQELDLDAMFKELRNRLAEKKEKKSASKKDVTKAIALFKKSKQNFENAITSLEVAIGLLEGDDTSSDDINSKEDVSNRSEEYQANVEKHPEALYGRKTNGEPKKPAGKLAMKLKAEAAKGGNLFGEGDTSSTDTDAPGEAENGANDVNHGKPAKTKAAKAPAKSKDANQAALDAISALENA